MIKQEYIQCLSGAKDINVLYDKLKYIKKTAVTDERILLILPCNPGGANHGNYFLSGVYPYIHNNWRKTDIWLRNIRSKIYFAAHSCVEFKYKDGNGALVYEHEMHRVKNDFDYGKPAPDVFTFEDSTPGFNMYKMVEDLIKGLNRALDYGFTRIISIQTPSRYKMGFAAAVDRMNLWDITTLVDAKMGTYSYLMKSINSIITENITGILYHPKFSYRFTDSNTSGVPEIFQYHKNKIFKDFTTIFDNIKIYGEGCEHNLPILISDSAIPLKELTTKYELPYYQGFYENIYAYTNNNYF